jgi:MoaA/NifB/PqqE/SkfB family radical SAM enzyme
MCDIWKDNKNNIELGEEDILPLRDALRKLNTQELVLSGGEALLHSNFFKLCALLKEVPVKITLLSTGMGLQRHIPDLIRWVDNIIVSLDGDAPTHNRIRDIPNAFSKLESSIQAIKSQFPYFPISARTVIHKENFKRWKEIIQVAKRMGLDHISFLPADLTSQAFNRLDPWNLSRQNEIAIPISDLSALEAVTYEVVKISRQTNYKGFILESPEKLMDIFRYYNAVQGLGEFPYKKCNAPWVSTVIEADGTVRPCFFLESMGNIQSESLLKILNSEASIKFRKDLNPSHHETCKRCVCSLNLSPFKNLS